MGRQDRMGLDLRGGHRADRGRDHACVGLCGDADQHRLVGEHVGRDRARRDAAGGEDREAGVADEVDRQLIAGHGDLRVREDPCDHGRLRGAQVERLDETVCAEYERGAGLLGNGRQDEITRGGRLLQQAPCGVEDTDGGRTTLRDGSVKLREPLAAVGWGTPRGKRFVVDRDEDRALMRGALTTEVVVAMAERRVTCIDQPEHRHDGDHAEDNTQPQHHAELDARA